MVFESRSTLVADELGRMFCAGGSLFMIVLIGGIEVDPTDKFGFTGTFNWYGRSAATKMLFSLTQRKKHEVTYGCVEET